MANVYFPAIQGKVTWHFSIYSPRINVQGRAVVGYETSVLVTIFSGPLTIVQLSFAMSVPSWVQAYNFAHKTEKLSLNSYNKMFLSFGQNIITLIHKVRNAEIHRENCGGNRVGSSQSRTSQLASVSIYIWIWKLTSLGLSLTPAPWCHILCAWFTSSHIQLEFQCFRGLQRRCHFLF